MSSDKQKELEDRRARLSPEKRALLEQRLRNAKPEAASQAIPRRRSAEPARLSFAQQRLWFLDRLHPRMIAYNVPLLYRLRGPLDEPAFHKSLDEIVRRHEILRAVFAEAEGEGRQTVRDAGPAQVVVQDVRDTADPVEAARRFAAEQGRQVIDLTQGPPCRFGLTRSADDEHFLLALFHHIVFDGWSTEVFLRELAACYEAFSMGKPCPLPELSIQYADFAEWQRETFGSAPPEKSLAYWKRLLTGELDVFELPTDRPRPPSQTFQGALLRRPLTKQLSEQVQTFSHREGVTAFVTLMAAWNVLLCRYTGQEDILVGSALAGRDWPGVEPLIGFFVNTVLLRTDLSGDTQFRGVVQRVREGALNAHEHQSVPFEKIVELIRLGRDRSGSQLFQTVFGMESAPSAVLEFGGLTLCEEESGTGTAKFDIAVVAGERGERLVLSAEYDTDLFDARSIAAMLGHYEVLLQGAIDSPEAHISELPLLRAEERERLLREWNAPVTDLPPPCCIHEAFEAQARKTPEAVAVEWQDQHLTYRELDAQAGAIAQRLRALNVPPGTAVGLFMAKRPAAIAGLLGTLKAGCVYLPIDPAYPDERVAFLLEDAQARVALTTKTLADRLSHCGAQALCMDADCPAPADASESGERCAVTPEQAAYVIYTSGSTGKPKGVCVAHREAAWHFATMCRAYEIRPEDRVLQFASLGFDVSLEQILVALTSGATLVMAEAQDCVPAEFSSFLRAARINVSNIPPAFWQQWLEEGMGPGQAGFGPQLRLLIVGGDIAPLETVRKWQRNPATAAVRLVNAYGPTETVITATLFDVPSGFAETARSARIPIGRPLPGTETYILDKYRNPAPVGVVGDLYIGGNRLARGYLNRPELTQERFVAHPFSDCPGARLYRTGDLARYLPDGTIEFLGRADGQVKIRGFRIELGEIEGTLLRHASVREAVVLRREDRPGEPQLVAYVVAKEASPIGVHGLRDYLHTSLPDYMVPSVFVLLDTLPLTASGKVDRRALPEPSGERPEMDTAYAAPRTQVEMALADIWKAHLGLERIGTQDNFFFLGGHSLLAMRVMAQVRAKLGVDLPLRILFDRPTIEALAHSVESAQGGGTGAEAPPASVSHPYHPCIVVLRGEGTKRPLFCALGAGGIVYNYGALASRLDRDQPVYGLQYSHLDDMESIFQSVETIALRYVDAIRTVQPTGPYSLAGWSFGGVVAFEVAQQLRQQGEEIALLGMMDCSIMVRIENPIRRLLEAIRVQTIRAWNRFLIVFHTRAVIWAYVRDFLRQTGRASTDTGRRAPSLREYVRFIRSDIHQLYSMKQAGLAVPDAGENRLGMLQDSFIRGIVERLEANVTAHKQYVMRPYSGSVTLFRTSRDPYGFARRDSTLGWSMIAKGGVDVHVIESNHFALVREPYVGTLATMLQTCLDNVQQ